MLNTLKPLAFLCILASMLWSCSPSEPDTTPSTETEAEELAVYGSRSPLYVSPNYGNGWVDVGFNLPASIEGSFLESYEDRLLLATDNEGLYLSSENRTQWRQIGGQLPGTKINALLVDKSAIYVGVYQKGVFKGNSDGLLWEELNFGLPDLRVQALLKVGSTLIAGTDSGIFLLEEGQNNWTKVMEGIQVVSLTDYQGKLVAGSSKGSLLSEDNGQNWQWIHKDCAVHYTHMVDHTIFEFCLSGALFFSNDWGKTWEEANYSPMEGSYVYEIVADGDFLVLSNNYGIHRSSDGGKNWQLVYPNEAWGFFDLLTVDGLVYGVTRTWKEYRGKS